MKLVSSSYIAKQQQEEADGSLRKSKFLNAANTALRLPDSRLPPLEMVNHVGSPDLPHFRTSSAYFFNEIASRLRIDTDASVLDLGCGCGRQAIPFVRHLEKGYFHGVDTWAEGIDWCNRHLRSPRATFICVPEAAADSDAAASHPALEWISPGSIDAAMAVSVFTRLDKHAIAAQLNEAVRVMKPGAPLYATFFRLDRQAWRYINATRNHADLVEQEEGCFYAPAGAHRFAGYTEEVLDELIGAAGLRIVSFELGEWAQKPGARNQQDSYILEKAD